VHNGIIERNAYDNELARLKEQLNGKW
jgi:hypothetical protein